MLKSEKIRNARRLQCARFLILFVALFILVDFSRAENYIPASDDEILESVPSQLFREQRQVRNESKFQPATQSHGSRLKAAQGAVLQGKSRQDPRFYGQAEALLEPILQSQNPPTEALLLWADILQHNHRFSEALNVLQTVLNRKLDNSSALLMRASILTTTGDLHQANATCKDLKIKFNGIIAEACIAGTATTLDELQDYSRMLEGALKAEEIHPSVKSWAEGILGEIFERTGDIPKAEAAYRRGLAETPADSFLLAMLSDLLISQGKQQEVLNLLPQTTEVDSLLLRRALAQKGLNDSNFQNTKTELEKRFSAAEQRGDFSHYRERAIYFLDIAENPEEAWKAASKNWDTQREGIDARTFLRAALLSGNSLSPLQSWLEKTGFYDSRILPLLSKPAR